MTATDIIIHLKGSMLFIRSTKKPDNGQIQMMGRTFFVNNVPSDILNGPIENITVTGSAWNDGSIHVGEWVDNQKKAEK